MFLSIKKMTFSFTEFITSNLLISHTRKLSSSFFPDKELQRTCVNKYRESQNIPVVLQTFDLCLYIRNQPEYNITQNNIIVVRTQFYCHRCEFALCNGEEAHSLFRNGVQQHGGSVQVIVMVFAVFPILKSI